MNEQIDCIVLKQQEFKEKDVLLTVLTKGFGKFTILARGILKMESKNASACMPYSLSNFSLDYNEQAKIQLLKSANVLQTHRKIRENLEKMSIASIFCDIADRLSENDMVDENGQAVFEVLKTCLTFLNEDNDIDLVLSCFTSNILKILGVAPVVDECVVCGESKVVGIAIENGGFVCEECGKQMNYEKKEARFLKQFRLINKANLQHYPILKEHGPWGREMSFLLLDFLILHSGIQVTSYQFLKSL